VQIHKARGSCCQDCEPSIRAWIILSLSSVCFHVWAAEGARIKWREKIAARLIEPTGHGMADA
jgi:hypothetical protein